ncbi:hypothetical protein IW262DRAFT_1293646 [Armillaria fumosa]|nr:hypothetical protein IW262DRAFT_1293646 [Armillaria fumosa]
MVSAAQSRQTGQPNGDWVAVPLLFLPLATTSLPTTSLHAMEQPIKWHMKGHDKPPMTVTTTMAYQMTTSTITMDRVSEAWRTHMGGTKRDGRRVEQCEEQANRNIETPMTNDGGGEQTLLGINGRYNDGPIACKISRTALLPRPPLVPASPPNIDIPCPTQDAHTPQVCASPTL